MVNFRSACASAAVVAALGAFVAAAPAAAQTRNWGDQDVRGGDSHPLQGGSEETFTRDLPPLAPLRASRARERVKQQEVVRKVRDESKDADLSATDSDVMASSWTPALNADPSLREGILEAFRRDDPQAGVTRESIPTMEVRQFDTVGDRKAQAAVRLHGRDGDDIRLLWFDASQHWRLGPSIGPEMVFQRIPAGIRPGFLGAAEHAPKYAVMVNGVQWAQRPRAAWMPVSGAYIGGRPRQPTKVDIGTAQLTEPGVAINSAQQNAWNSFLAGEITPEKMFAQDVFLKDGEDPAAYLYIRNPAFCANGGTMCRFVLYDNSSHGGRVLFSGVTATGIYMQRVPHASRVGGVKERLADASDGAKRPPEPETIRFYGFSTDGAVFLIGEIER